VQSSRSLFQKFNDRLKLSIKTKQDVSVVVSLLEYICELTNCTKRPFKMHCRRDVGTTNLYCVSFQPGEGQINSGDPLFVRVRTVNPYLFSIYCYSVLTNPW